MKKLNEQQNIRYKVNESEFFRAYNEPTLFHYADLDKPWLNKTEKFNRVYWWYYAKLTDFYDQILHHYGFNRIDVEALLKKIPKDGGLLKRKFMK